MFRTPVRTRVRHRLTLGAAVLALLASFVTATVQSAQPAAAADGRPYTNPVKAQKGADPWLEYYNGNYYLVTTSFTGELTMRKSPTLAGLSTAPSVQVWSIPYWPRRNIDSARFSPNAEVRMRTSPRPGTGSGTSSRRSTSGPPVWWKRTARFMT
ncbi:putative glycosyl hydrolase [Streptomyces bingchenggensis BCW-1]|uniref:Putative glycosyl hydrolase n=1 Tax=Streptomyces bingchenggensis (strain BCW-1) TaxID=749414 RepID=D7BXW1_STRBB|nr:putative glycosyl hydrolase [Streptomyces bingchenggensis BCW-1]